MAKIALATGKDYNFPVTLTKAIQDEIAEIIERLPITAEDKKILILRVTEVEVEENLAVPEIEKVAKNTERSPKNEEDIPF